MVPITLDQLSQIASMFSRDRETEDRLNRSTMFRRKSRMVKFMQADKPRAAPTEENNSRLEPLLSNLRISRAQQARALDQKSDLDEHSSTISSVTGSVQTDNTESPSFGSTSTTDESSLSIGKTTYIIHNTNAPSPGKTRYTISARDHFDTSTPSNVSGPSSVRTKPNFRQICNMFETARPAQIVAPRPLSTSQVTSNSTIATKAGRSVCVEVASGPQLGLGGVDVGRWSASTERQSRRRSRTSSSDPVRSQAAVQPHTEKSPMRSLSASRRGPPPASFPHNFYARGYTDHQAGLANPARLPLPQRMRTPSISPHTVVHPPLVQSTSSSPTPMDSRGHPSFHAVIHYFTTCPHSAPPASRPLDPDAQPRVDTRYMPPPSRPDQIRSIISGPCVNCDAAERRSEERSIMNTCTDELINLTHQLHEMVSELEIVDSTYYDEGVQKQKIAQFHANRIAPGLASDDNDTTLQQPSEMRSIVGPEIDTAYIDHLSSQVMELEGQIATLREQQETQIKNAWKGFIKRWGASALATPRGGYHSTPEAYLTFEDETALEQQRERGLLELLASSPTTELAPPSPLSDFMPDDDEDDNTDIFIELGRAENPPCRRPSRGRGASRVVGNSSL